MPIVTINTNGLAIPDDPKITADLRICQNPSGTTRPKDSATVYFGKIGIETRGSTSQQISPKKPFGIELRDARGNEKDVALFGGTKEADWALIAPYSDKTLMRDALAYHLASTFMPYAPKTTFCELLINDVYQGVYVLTETVKRKRLGIAKLDSTALSGDALTGGYILKIDKNTGNPTGTPIGFISDYYTGFTPTPTTYQFHYPKPEDIKPAQAAYIKTFVKEFETVMRSPQFNDDKNGYAKYFDVQSLVDFWIMNEITRNVDGYRLSTYLYKDKNSISPKLKMGPIWDFNIALGNADYCSGGNYYGWASNFNTVCPTDNWTIPFWWQILLEDKKFKRLIQTRWKALRQNQLKTTHVLAVIDSFNTILAKPQERNFKKWDILTKYVWPNSAVNNTYVNEILSLKTWLDRRLIWMDTEIQAFAVAEHPVKLTDIEIFPNPSLAYDNVRFAYYLFTDAEVELQVFNELGQLVSGQKVQQLKGDNELIFRGNGQKGVFMYNLLRNGKVVQKGKLVKI
ncbi:MAG: CotH kinase family protein [Saprospiraceae bacterium]|nr:CotH kinase family protein [Saprospiraceae bacterium]